MKEYEYFECSADYTKASFARVLKAIVDFDGAITSVFNFCKSLQGGAVFYMIKLPIGCEFEFEEQSKTKLKKPSKFKINREPIL